MGPSSCSPQSEPPAFVGRYLQIPFWGSSKPELRTEWQSEPERRNLWWARLGQPARFDSWTIANRRFYGSKRSFKSARSRKDSRRHTSKPSGEQNDVRRLQC